MKPRNRCKKRWPRAYNSRAKLALLDFNFVLACDRIEWEALTAELQQECYHSPGELIAIGRDAAQQLEKCRIPQNEWEQRYAAN